MDQAEALVREFCEVVRQRDASLVRPFFSDDVVYHNIPMDPAEGIDAAMAVIEMFFGICEGLEFEIHHLSSDGETVLTERTDTFTISGTTAPLPVMGAFCVQDAKITQWRDYFDMGQVNTIFGLA